MTQDDEIARKLLISLLSSNENIRITYRAWVEAKRDFDGLSKDGIIYEVVSNLKNGIKITHTQQDSGSTGWVIKPTINTIPAYIKLCIEDDGDEMILTIVSTHK